MKGLRSWLVIIAGCSAAFAAQAGPGWSESANGDFSNNGLAPTPVSFTAGGNPITGNTGNAGQGIDRDYFNFTVPPGARLTSLVMLENTFVSGSSSFLAVQTGPQVTVSPSGAGSQNLLGFLHYTNDQVGVDILPLLAPSYPEGLPSGTYSVWLQEIGGTVDYGFNFTITAEVTSTADAPLPIWAYGALGSVLLWLGWRGSARSQTTRRLIRSR